MMLNLCLALLHESMTLNYIMKYLGMFEIELANQLKNVTLKKKTALIRPYTANP